MKVKWGILLPRAGFNARPVEYELTLKRGCSEDSSVSQFSKGEMASLPLVTLRLV